MVDFPSNCGERVLLVVLYLVKWLYICEYFYNFVLLMMLAVFVCVVNIS